MPTTSTLLEPRSLRYQSREREKLKDVQNWQARYYNAHAKDQPPLNEGDAVQLKPFQLKQKEWKKGVGVERLDDRSYEIETADGATYMRKINEPTPRETVSEPLRTPTRYRNARLADKLPPGSTLTEMPQVPSYSDEPEEHTPCEMSLARYPPCSEPCKETKESAAEVRTRSVRLVTRPSYLKEFVA